MYCLNPKLLHTLHHTRPHGLSCVHSLRVPWVRPLLQPASQRTKILIKHVTEKKLCGAYMPFFVGCTVVAFISQISQSLKGAKGKAKGAVVHFSFLAITVTYEVSPCLSAGALTPRQAPMFALVDTPRLSALSPSPQQKALSRAVQGLLSSLIHYHNCYSRQARHSSRPPPGSRGTA